MNKSEFIRPYRMKMYIGMVVMFCNMGLAVLAVIKLIDHIGPYLPRANDDSFIAPLISGAIGGVSIAGLFFLFSVPGIIIFRRYLPRCPNCRRIVARLAWETGQCQNCRQQLFEINASSFTNYQTSLQIEKPKNEVTPEALFCSKCRSHNLTKPINKKVMFLSVIVFVVADYLYSAGGYINSIGFYFIIILNALLTAFFSIYYPILKCRDCGFQWQSRGR